VASFHLGWATMWVWQLLVNVTAGADLSYVHVICSVLNKLPSASDVATNPFTLPSMCRRFLKAHSQTDLSAPCCSKTILYTVWLKKLPPRLSEYFFIFQKRLRLFNRFFTHLLYVLMYARLQIFIQLSPTLAKLCRIKRDYLVHIMCAKCPKRAKTRAFRRLRKSLIALLIVVCGKSL